MCTKHRVASHTQKVCFTDQTSSPPTSKLYSTLFYFTVLSLPLFFSSTVSFKKFQQKKTKKQKSMFMALLLLASLFIGGLMLTLLTSPVKKLLAVLLRHLSPNSPPNAPKTPGIAHKEVKRVSKHDRDELKCVFATFDKDKDGFITKQELIVSLENVGFTMSEREVADVVEKVDSNGDGLIDLGEFCGIFESLEEIRGGEGEGEATDHLKEAFKVFDENGDGLITVEELSLVLSSLGLKEGQRLESCKEMIKKVDMDGDGMVSFDEFKRMMKAGGKLLSVS